MTASITSRRACITGYAALSPIGNSAAAFWDGLLVGRCGLGPIRSFDTTGVSVARAGEVKDFQPAQWLLRDEIERLDRIHQFSLYTGRAALADAQLDLATSDRARVGVILSTCLSGMLIGEEYQRCL